MEKKQPDPLFDFIACIESAALVVDNGDFVVKANEKFHLDNKIFNFFQLRPNNSYVLDKLDKEEWYLHLTLCFSAGAARFLLRTSFYECVMTRINLGGKAYVLANFFENKAVKEDVADIFLNDFRMSQIKELSEMAASIAHEINNPLTIISARTQLLKQVISGREVIETAKISGNLDKIGQQSDRIKKIVDGMRVFARDSSVDLRTVYNIKSLVEEAHSLVAGGIRDSGIDFHFDLEQNEKNISCKPNELIQVLVNLFNNSIYALAKTTFPKIEVKFEEDERFYHLYFSDNGPGIPAEHESKIFVPFFTTKPVGSGTGLGLSICNKIVQSYDGELRLDRTRGNSCFHISLAKNTENSNYKQSS